MKKLLNVYRRITVGLFFCNRPCSWRCAFTGGFNSPNGWGKRHNLAKITRFFASLNVPVPGFTALAISTLEFVGGIFLMLGLFSGTIAFHLACNMFVAYRTADSEALTSVFSDPARFYVADPYTFLFVSLMVLIFGSGLFAVDDLIAKRVKAFEQ